MNIKSIGRNDPCPCGSGKKYKQCCQDKEAINNAKPTPIDLKKLLQEAQTNQNNGNPLDAIKCYQQILNQYPKHSESLYQLGQLHNFLGEYQSAINYFLKGIKHEPSAQMYCGLADAFIATQQMTEAHKCYTKAILLNPGESMLYNNFGAFFLKQQNYTEAEKHLKKAFTLNKNTFFALTNLSSICLIYGQHKEAVSLIQQAIKIAAYQDNYFKLFFCLCFDTQLFKQIYLQEAKNLELLLLKHVSTPYYPNTNNVIKKDETHLKIGFVSGDIRVHPVAHFLESTLKELSKSKKLTLIAYYTQHFEDYKTNELKSLFDQWHNVASLTYSQSAKQIYNDNIDILIDLAGYTAKTGIGIFAWHPAKIQISWLGYYASTGLRCMDYFLADPIGVTASNKHLFTEEIWYLPDTRLCFSEPDEGYISITPPPITTNGYVTFGCFQNITKINDHVLGIWSKILQKCPNSKILIKNKSIKDEYVRRKLISRFEIHGILENQLIFDKDSQREDYFKSYNKVDFLLDTFPFPGGTTTCEALWMGVPTLTLTGETLLERQGHSLLNAAGLTNWVCFNENEYIQKAIDFSQDINYLTTLRNNLRNQTLNSPLMNAQLFAKNLEQALFDIWEHHHKIKI